MCGILGMLLAAEATEPVLHYGLSSIAADCLTALQHR